ncbi:MAG: NAD-dependent epimerase/dehydratase family protein [Deltaproteobacteria bacterium]|nr:NAD-dependent epimerase/dehydratase family protein [Deltaproteobacteria bacterium]
MNAIVLGAAGFLGLNLVDALIAGGVVPRCGRRRREFVIPLKKRKVPMVVVELDEPEVLASAMEGCDVVFHAAGHYPRFCVDPEAVLELGIRQTRNALDAAARAGVQRFVYVSTTATVAPNPDGPSTEEHVYSAPPGYGLYHHRGRWSSSWRRRTASRRASPVRRDASGRGIYGWPPPRSS